MENYPLIWYTALVKILTRLNILICPPPSKQKTKYKAIVMLISRPRFVFWYFAVYIVSTELYFSAGLLQPRTLHIQSGRR
jgi:hypothetical protein